MVTRKACEWTAQGSARPGLKCLLKETLLGSLAGGSAALQQRGVDARWQRPSDSVKLSVESKYSSFFSRTKPNVVS